MWAYFQTKFLFLKLATNLTITLPRHQSYELHNKVVNFIVHFDLMDFWGLNIALNTSFTQQGKVAPIPFNNGIGM